MKNNVWQDAKNWTHIDWELGDVTSQMIDWFWCNMEKCDYLWHPNQHNDFEWMKGYSIKELETPIKSIHIAPQTGNDGTPIRPYIRIEAIEDVPEEIRAIIKYDHVVIAGGISILGDDVDPNAPVLAYRVHQWQKTDQGLIGMSSGIEAKANEADSGLIWAAHACEEVGNWEVFLPDLFRLYKVITRRDICPYYSFKLEGLGKDAKYVAL